jgi:hypothetical protein
LLAGKQQNKGEEHQIFAAAFHDWLFEDKDKRRKSSEVKGHCIIQLGLK